MSVEDPAVVDHIGFNEGAGEVVLTIADHLYWHQAGHLDLLDKKLAGYLAFARSGELERKYPQSKRKKIAFLIAGKYFMNRTAQAFFVSKQEALANDGVELRFVRPSEGENRFSRWINSWLEPWLQR